MPEGRCVRRTAESVLFTCCPPAPLERYVSTRRSSSRMSIWISSSMSGKTKTEAKELELGEAVLDLLDLRGELAERLGRALLGKLEEDLRLVDALALAPKALDRVAHGGRLAAHSLGLLGILPEIRRAGLLAQLRRTALESRQVKDASRARRRDGEARARGRAERRARGRRSWGGRVPCGGAYPKAACAASHVMGCRGSRRRGSPRGRSAAGPRRPFRPRHGRRHRGAAPR